MKIEISLRDYFAGQALSGMLASEREDDENSMTMDEVVNIAYGFADEMMQQKEVEQVK